MIHRIEIFFHFVYAYHFEEFYMLYISYSFPFFRRRTTSASFATCLLCVTTMTHLFHSFAQFFKI